MATDEATPVAEKPETGTSNWRDSLEDSFYRKTREARDRLNSILEDVGEKANATGKHVKHGVELTEDQIRENPWAAVGIAASVGLLLGLLLNRSR
jgi:ElaB/YqjD/DUF883 family membrane-anchored ribosome-binding protein